MAMKVRFRRPMENYQGRHIGCAPGTHAGLVKLIVQHAKPSAGVLDFGAHSGALLLRLRDAGFSDLHGADLDPTRFDVPGADFHRVDLNTDFASSFSRRFRLITATDVIEHLDSPREFLKQVHQLLTDDGLLALSLPNVAFWEGRLKFALRGELWGFGRRNYETQRHISPMTFEQMLATLEEIGFQPMGSDSAGSFATILRWTATAPLWAPLRLIGGPKAFGESALFLAQKARPNVDLTMPVHYRDRWRGVPDQIGIDDETAVVPRAAG
jgi:2-polyprenyl-3-methyl-5-hydroxy-6-metoxy-1,4-benzoquinol methylase